MRGRAETVRSTAVWADTTRPYPVGQEGVEAMVDVSSRVAHEPGTTPFVDTIAFPDTNPAVSAQTILNEGLPSKFVNREHVDTVRFVTD